MPDPTVVMRSRLPLRIAAVSFAAVAALTTASAVGTHVIDTRSTHPAQSTR